MIASEVATQTCMRMLSLIAGNAEKLVKDGHNNAAAADAEEPCEKPHEQAGHKGRGKRGDFA